MMTKNFIGFLSRTFTITVFVLVGLCLCFSSLAAVASDSAAYTGKRLVPLPFPSSSSQTQRTPAPHSSDNITKNGTHENGANESVSVVIKKPESQFTLDNELQFGNELRGILAEQPAIASHHLPKKTVANSSPNTSTVSTKLRNEDDKIENSPTKIIQHAGYNRESNGNKSNVNEPSNYNINNNSNINSNSNDKNNNNIAADKTDTNQHNTDIIRTQSLSDPLAERPDPPTNLTPDLSSLPQALLTDKPSQPNSNSATNPHATHAKQPPHHIDQDDIHKNQNVQQAIRNNDLVSVVNGWLLVVTIVSIVAMIYAVVVAVDYHQRWIQSLTLQNDRFAIDEPDYNYKNIYESINDYKLYW
ncbi:MAG: hypothetical protein LBQ66_04845 [Planctomycetaceae bacterium]|jgi:hypothetical protein|nr:hypothetical protein [Planctomycetaceae bacterium]